MAIQPTDIHIRLSGGASNTNPSASLGGAKSSTDAPSNVFDDITSSEAGVGSTEYRCGYVHNAHASLTLQNAHVWLSANTPSITTTVDIGLGTSALNGTEQTVANEKTAPSGVTFSAAATEATAIALGDIPPGQGRAIWFRRSANAGTTSVTDTFTVNVGGDTQ